MNELIDLISKELPNNEVRRRVVDVLIAQRNNPTQKWIDALRNAYHEMDERLTEIGWNE